MSERIADPAPGSELATSTPRTDAILSEVPVRMPEVEMDVERLKAITDYLSLTTKALERMQSLREQVHEILNDEFIDRKLCVLSRLARDMTSINPTIASVPPLLCAEELDELFARFAGYRTELAVATRKVVQQESLDSGDIELF